MLQRRALHDFPSSAAGRIVSNVVMMGMGEVRCATGARDGERALPYILCVADGRRFFAADSRCTITKTFGGPSRYGEQWPRARRRACAKLSRLWSWPRRAQILKDGDGLALSKRRITLSTSGVVPLIERVGADLGINLAISLHAVTNELRNRLVPINKTYPLEALLDACRCARRRSKSKRANAVGC